MFCWIPNLRLFVPRSPRRFQRRTRTCSPRLELLEDRRVLATITSVNGIALSTTNLACTGVGVAAINLQGPVEPASDFSATIDWGDQSNPVQADVIKYTSADMNQLIVRGSHTFGQTGDYSITVTVYHATETPVAATAFGHVGTGQVMYVTSTSGNAILAIDSAGHVSTFANTTPSFAPSGPTGIALDAKGNVYVANIYTNAVQEFSPSGQDMGVFCTGLNLPTALAFDAGGNLYVANARDGVVEKFSPSGQDLGAFVVDQIGVYGILFDSQGNFFQSNGYAPNTSWIKEYSPSGQFLRTFASGWLSEPDDMCLDTQGNLYVLNSLSANIAKFAPDGQFLGIFANVSVSEPFNGLRFDAEGNLYACEYFQGKIEKFDSTGHSLGFFASGLNNPDYIAFGPAPTPSLAPETSTVVASSSTGNTSTYGDGVTFTATVTNISGSTAPSGGVELFDGATDLGPGSLGSSGGNSTNWTFTTTALHAGSHDIHAYFTSSFDFNDSNGDATQAVDSRVLHVNFTGSDKVYDGTTAATLSYSDDALPGDSVSLTYSASFADKSVGVGQTANISNLVISGPSAADYVLPSTTAIATASITPRALTVTAVGIDKAYDGATNASVLLSDNRISGDAFSDSFTSAVFVDPNVGTSKPISVSGISISGPDAGNYSWNTATMAFANITPGATAGSAYTQNGMLFLVATSDADAFTLTATLPTGAASYSMKVTRLTNGKTVQLGTFAVPTQAIEIVAGNSSDSLKLVGSGTGDSFAYDFVNTTTYLSLLAAASSVQATGFNLDLGGLSAVTLQGGAGSDTLVAATTGPGGINTWDITGSNAGTLNGISFTGIENLLGNAADDHFVFIGTGSVSGVVDGGSGNNVLDFSGRTGNLTVTLRSSGYNAASGTGGWGNIGTIYGAAAATNTFVGAGAPNSWHIDGMNSGDVNGQVAFIGFAYLTGGSGDDTFQFSPGGSIAGNLSGGSGSDTLDFSAISASVTVNLAARTAAGLCGAWTSISTFIGAGSTDTLVGANTTNTWQITGAGSGVVTGSIAFQGFTNLIGGSLNDSFQISPGGSVTGLIDGQGGVNTLNYSSYSDNVYANLQTAQATGTGGIAAIQNLTGGLGNDILVGDANNNVLIDKAGRNLVIGGGGGDLLTSGTGGSILIAGKTVYDQDALGLAALELVWAGSSNYNLAVGALLSGVDYIGADGQHHLAALNGDTVSQPAGSSPSTLTGGSSLDWFFAALGDSVKNRKTGEIIMTL
jgi:sugar lactone lactonase YvrE